MKIYRYNIETGGYLGEDFADEALMQREARVVPLDATTIEPPPAVKGQISVFNVRLQCWELRTRPSPAGKRLRGKLDDYPYQTETRP